MAQTIQIKRSTTTAVPSSLSAGELAYSFKSDTKKLYIGDGSSVFAVGGQSFTDKLDGIAAGANNYTLPLATDTVRGGVELFSNTDQSVAANSVTTTAGRTYGIQLNSDDQMVVNVPWTDSSGNNKMPLAGGTFTGDVTFTGDNGNIVFDKSDDSLEFADDVKAVFGASGDLKIFHGTEDIGGSNIEGSYIIENGTGNLIMQGSNLEIRSTTDELYAQFVQDGVSKLYCDNAQKLSTKSDGVLITGEMQSDSLDVNGVGDISGNLTVHGDLTVNGTTTTVDSQTVVFEDNILLLNKNVTGTPTGQAGLEVERGTSVNAFIVWNEATDRWSIGLGSALNPNVLDTSTLSALNVENVAINGGTF